MSTVPHSQTGQRISRQDAILRRVRAEQAREREQGRANMRAFGKRLDQIELCYKQHTPPQVRFAGPMRECP